MLSFGPSSHLLKIWVGVVGLEDFPHQLVHSRVCSATRDRYPSPAYTNLVRMEPLTSMPAALT